MTAKRAFQAFAAVIFGVMLVTAAALGGVWATNPHVDSFEDATNEIVGTGEALLGVGTAAVVGVAIGGAAAKLYYDTKADIKQEKLQQADALETKKSIYQSANVHSQNNQIIQTAYSNYLNDTQSIALMSAKNAYIRALENGSSEPAARTSAREAVADYYSKKQQNLITSWNTAMVLFNSSEHTEENSTGVSESYVQLSYTATGADSLDIHSTDVKDVGQTQVQLLNSEAANISTARIYIDHGAYHTPSAHFVDPVANCPSTGVQADVHHVSVQPPSDNFQTSIEYANTSEYHQKWDRIKQQNNAVQSQIDTFINNTYQAYPKGDINPSDLVDPYLGTREYAPQNSSQFQAWALQSLSSLGLNSPENLSNVGHMTVVEGTNSYDGILMSDENPRGGFVVGNTYNASNLDGPQFVAPNDGGLVELEGEFTLKSAETAQGQTVEKNETITYRNVTYETANMTEYRNLQQELDKLQAQVNARQQNLRNSGGGFLPDFGLGGIGGLGVPVMLLLLAGGAVLVLGRD
jgi:hypothetical protein